MNLPGGRTELPQFLLPGFAANKNFCRVSKYSEAELMGQNHNIICSGYHPKEFFQNLWNTISSGKLWRGEIKNKARDGSYYWVDSIILPVLDKKKMISSYLSLRSVITKRKEADLHKEEYIEALEQIAFSVSHRVRSPLCSIMGLTNLLQNHQDLPEDIQSVIMHMTESTNKLDALTRELAKLIYSGDLALRQMNYNDSLDQNY